jgi:hypothetical protein
MVNKKVLGWKEWVSLPELGVSCILAKLATGSDTSCIHVTDEKLFIRNGIKWVRFTVMLNSHGKDVITAESPLISTRIVKNVNGVKEKRSVIKTKMCIGKWSKITEIMLTHHDAFKYNMAVGRKALSGTALIEPEHEFLYSRAICKDSKLS